MAEPTDEMAYDPDSSDAEHETVDVTEPQWRKFERNMADLISKLDPDAEVSHNCTINGRFSGIMRQVDVLVRGAVADQLLTIAIECKRYARRLGIGGVDEFAGKLLDLGVERGVLYALGGFTAGAERRAAGAQQPQIQLRDIAIGAPGPTPWQPGLPEFTGFGDCPNPNCYTGDINWSEWSDTEGVVIEAGSCGTCGTWSVRCPQCGTETGFYWDEVECNGCERQYALVWDRKGGNVEGVVAL